MGLSPKSGGRLGWTPLGALMLNLAKQFCRRLMDEEPKQCKQALKANRASCPTGLTLTEPPNLNNSYGSAHSSSSNISIERLTATDDEEPTAETPNVKIKPSKPLPEWITVGESILVRPYNWSGIISFIGATQFASGTWIGVSLDVPTGKHDGSVQGVSYFSCKPKHGIFVKSDKLILDKRGRALHSFRGSTEPVNSSSAMRRSQSKAEGMSESARKIAISGDASMRRSKSRADGLNRH